MDCTELRRDLNDRWKSVMNRVSQQLGFNKMKGNFFTSLSDYHLLKNYFPPQSSLLRKYIENVSDRV
jgi:hypothetical protein